MCFHCLIPDSTGLCRTHALLIKPPRPVGDFLGLIGAGTEALVAAQGAEPLHSVLSGRPVYSQSDPEQEQKACMLMVGPEGDFTGDELSALVSAGAKAVGLGGNRLRVETAAIALLAGAVLYAEGLR